MFQDAVQTIFWAYATSSSLGREHQDRGSAKVNLLAYDPPPTSSPTASKAPTRTPTTIISTGFPTSPVSRSPTLVGQTFYPTYDPTTQIISLGLTAAPSLKATPVPTFAITGTPTVGGPWPSGTYSASGGQFVLTWVVDTALGEIEFMMESKTMG